MVCYDIFVSGHWVKGVVAVLMKKVAGWEYVEMKMKVTEFVMTLLWNNILGNHINVLFDLGLG